jgi:VWFA-related protein
MSSAITLARRAEPQWPARLLAVILSLIPAFLLCTLKAQTANPQEISSRDVEPTFKLQSERNLVMVRVVVRNSKGAVVENLRKEDFQLFDHGKAQTLVSFSLEKPALKASAPPVAKPAEVTPPAPEDEDESTVPASTARRFVALYFDDVNTPFENLARTRNAADHFLTSSVQPGDRVALFTSSGQKQVDFTDDKAQLHQALLALQPRPIVGQDTSCGAIPPYQAYLIVDQNDSQAITEAMDEYLNCTPCSTGLSSQQCLMQAQGMVQSEATRSLSQSEVQSTAALRGIESIVRRMTSLPGQRSLVIISGGFLTETLRFNLDQIADRALRAGVIINAIDARGLWIDPTLDVSRASFASTMNSASQGLKHLMILESARRQTDGMKDLALDTGGIFFQNSNDLDAGFRKVTDVPDAYYVLAFSPQNLKHDGTFHPLQVKLVSPKGFTVLARRGYYAPRKSEDATSQEKEEIREAVFSQDESHELPIDVHTQFFMTSETDARITVLTRLDLRPLHFRREVDRNVDKLTFVTVVFDQDGHEISAQEKTVDFHMHDITLEHYQQTGITMKSLFNVKPGTYLVRSVVRDSESGQIAGLNRTVEIPY